MSLKLIVTCEHGGNHIPREYRSAFNTAEEPLQTHRGWDAGALTLARHIAHYWQAELHTSTTSRLLVDLNRSLTNRTVFSKWSRVLPDEERQLILANYYHPYREQVSSSVKRIIDAGGQVLHLSVHSFTPIYEGRVRSTEIGLLSDPSRPREQAFVAELRNNLTSRLGESYVIHRNRPYRGSSDGLTTALRKVWKDNLYLGIELELSHKLLATDNSFPKSLVRYVAESLPI